MDLADSERRPSADEAMLAQLQAELAREVSPETQFTGALLKKAREALGVEIQDIAAITKISPMHLRAIEAEDAQALPAPVYVRGFLQQIAKALRLDPTQVTKTYLKRVRNVRPGFE
jgi:flagellar biosynthesis protein FlhG